jgi:ankyrin repeat protein
MILYILLSHKCNLEDHDSYGATALFEATDHEKVPIAKTLLDFGANPNVKRRTVIDGPSDVSALHAACKSKQLVQLLLDHGADASVRDSNGQTPADWIAEANDREFDLVKTSNGWRIRLRCQENGVAGRSR